MIDSRPWHTTTTLRDELHETQDARDQARDAQKVAEEQARRAEERAQTEADRADGNETHVLALLAEFAIDPTLPGHVVDGIAESIRQDLNGGLGVDRVAEVARGHVNTYLENR